jgi:4-amino-4-deoxy-L-arabinose transferase-like glycosyltransferase
MKNKQTPFCIMTIAIFLGTISPNMLSDGMFMDGLLYAAISNNLAQGMGSFWDLFLTHTLFPHFHEHPPLAFGIQSLFFKIFGNSIYIERIYSFSTFIITGFIITRIWYKVTKPIFHKLAWLPLFFWILVPLVTWSAPNNMLENTMMIFTSLSVLFFIKSIENKRVIHLVIAGVLLSLGVLTKGLVALFPLSLLLWYFAFNTNRNFIRLIVDSVILLISIVLPFVLLFIIYPESYDSLLAYFEKQIVGSISNVKTVDSRFYIIFRLLEELLPIIVIVFIIWLFSTKEKIINYSEKWFLILFLVGLSGVIPIMISMKQSGFYILATFPLFSIAFAILIMQNVNFLVEKININSKGFKYLRYFSYVLILLSVVLNLLQINKIGRDKDKIEDLYAVIQVVPKGATITIQPDLRNDWSLHGYFQRYGNISLDSDTAIFHRYILVKKTNRNIYLSKYKKRTINLNIYDLYENIKKH